MGELLVCKEPSLPKTVLKHIEGNGYSVKDVYDIIEEYATTMGSETQGNEDIALKNKENMQRLCENLSNMI